MIHSRKRLFTLAALTFLTFLTMTLVTSSAAWAFPAKWFDRSHKIFFPADNQETITLSQTFPTFWWNFVVFKTGESEQDNWKGAQKICRSLKTLSPELLLRVECNQGIEELRAFAKDWAQDLPIRSVKPSISIIREKLDGSLAKASLPTGDRGLLQFLQEDPLESWLELRKLLESHLKLDLERKNGFFYDPATHRVVIPVQIAFEPGATAKTRSILAAISGLSENTGAPSISLIGPHGSTLRNEERVATDLSSVSKVAYVILALFGVLLFSLKRWRLLLLFPPVFVAVAFGAAITIFIFGSIHGLTLSLGSGIVGLALDYGFNGALNDRSLQRQTWRSNLIGVTTTLVGLFVLMESTIPLLKQMMVFSATGLTAGFLIFHFLIRKYPKVFITPAIGIPFSPTRNKTGVVIFLLLASVAGLFTLHPNLDMKQFDFQDEHTKGVADWLYKRLDLRAPLLTVNSGPEALESAHREKSWADQKGVTIENIANYLPSPEQQTSYLKTWNADEPSYCEKLSHELTAVQRKFFSGFIDETLCNIQVARLTSTGTALRSYTWHLNSEDRWITLWMPSSDAQEILVRSAWPKSRSLREAVLAFPQILAKELSWMAPLSLAIVLVVLLLYYRRMRYCLIALIPFFSGLGLFTLVVQVLRLDVSFISVIALVMSFGFSFDYAVFAVDHYIFKKGELSDGVWEAISSAAFATLAGFIPLLFCKHPVLKHLGQALCLSTIGCYIGAVWGVPGFLAPRVAQEKGKAVEIV
jgi:hypothetical protein